jgi:hypothetical protein
MNKTQLRRQRETCPLLRGKTENEQRLTCLNCPMPRCFYELLEEQKGKLALSQWGQFGGAVIMQRYGAYYMTELAKRGGRPRKSWQLAPIEHTSVLASITHRRKKRVKSRPIQITEAGTKQCRELVPATGGGEMKHLVFAFAGKVHGLQAYMAVLIRCQGDISIGEILSWR